MHKKISLLLPRFCLPLLLVVIGCNDNKQAPKSVAPTSAPAGHDPAGHKAAAPAPAAKGLDKSGAMQISDTDRCPVCGMNIAKHRKFASAIELVDGRTYHFCGTGCLIKSWLHPEIFLGTPKGSGKRAVTPEYFGGTYVDALTAQWVAGSDVVGPMGPALVPLKDAADLKLFQQRHGGKATFRLDALDDARFEALTGKKATYHPHKKPQ